MSKDHLEVLLGHDLSDSIQIYTKAAAIDTDREFRKAPRSMAPQNCQFLVIEIR